MAQVAAEAIKAVHGMVYEYGPSARLLCESILFPNRYIISNIVSYHTLFQYHILKQISIKIQHSIVVFKLHM